MKDSRIDFYKFHYNLENEDRKFNRTSAFQYTVFLITELGAIVYFFQNKYFNMVIDSKYYLLLAYPAVLLVDVLLLLLFTIQFYIVIKIIYLFYSFSINQLNNNTKAELYLKGTKKNKKLIKDNIEYAYKNKSSTMNDINVKNANTLRLIRNYELDLFVILILFYIINNIQ